jgi:RNA polymerase sigma-70 factor (ECF subfamily)
MTRDHGQEGELLRRAGGGEAAALGALFALYRSRLRRMVQLRLDHRLQGRVDPSDVLQEAYIDLAERLPRYASKPTMPLFLWLRLVTAERLLRTHRHHLGAAMRDAGREISLYHGSLPQASSASLAAQLVGRHTTASRAAARAEMQLRLQETLNQMEPIDREIIALRHFEELSNDETAEVLGLTRGAASKRYVRAMLRLKEAFGNEPGLSGSSRNPAVPSSRRI